MSASADDVIASLSQRFLDAQLKGDRRQAVRLLVDEGLGIGVSPTEILLRVITPAQREIGRLWETNVVSVADEHVATAISQLVMSHLYGRSVPPVPRREHVVVACVDGEWHDMGARVAADVLEHRGFSVRLLGPSVPLGDLRRRVRAERPDLVLLSVTMAVHQPSLRKAVGALHEDFPAMPILVGGHGRPEDPSPLERPALAPTASHLCTEIEELLAA